MITSMVSIITSILLSITAATVMVAQFYRRHSHLDTSLKNRALTKLGEWGDCGLVGQGVAIGIGRFLVQTTLGARSSFGSQLRYEAPDDLRVEYVKRSD